MSRGFTLLELLVVLTLAALLVGLVGPSVVHQLAQARLRSQVAQTEAVLQSLPWRARRAGTALRFEARDIKALYQDAGDDLDLQVPVALQYDARGLTEGGRVRLLQSDGTQVAWDVSRHLGDVTRLATP